MSDLQIRKATRQGVRPIIDLYGESGSGKTFSALLLARGFVGPTGKMVMIDTESGRGSLYADVKEIGGYDVLQLDSPFSPARYIEAITAVEQSGATIGICDSCSHCWEGIGGVLDMADQNEVSSGKAGLHNWRQPKMEHAKFLLKMLQSSIPWIVCLRAKYKTRQAKNERGKTEIVKDDYPTPIQAEDFIFESTIHGLIDLDHKFHPRKVSHPSLWECLPNGGPITLEHGRLLAQWCASAGQPKTNGTPDKSSLLKELRTITESVHGWKKGMTPEQWDERKDTLEFWLVEQAIISDSERLASLDAGRLTAVLAKSKEILGGAK
jgi:hypothetical protein